MRNATEPYHLTDYGQGRPALCGELIDERPVKPWPTSLLMEPDSIFSDDLCPMCVTILHHREGNLDENDL